jgi:DNA invertase Pin-like site-specific DNA recombinase
MTKRSSGSNETKDLAGIRRKLRCAVYTRKSSEEGLEQEFNSLDAQREACEAYIASQKAEGWVLVPDRYDDGGVSGGTLERPALKRLLAAIEAGKVDIVVVYKIDRLSRSLMDFARLVEVFDRKSVTFVSVTQSFTTTTSMGRLTLNVLLSFAQFEREVIGERIRDKVAVSRRKGIWMGGWAPLGYDVKDRKLVINENEAKLVRSIFGRFAKYGSGIRLVRELAEEGARNKYSKPIDKGYLYKLLNNRVYLGDAVHKGTSYPGEHQAILTQDVWDKAHAVLKISPRKRAAKNRVQAPALLKGLIFGPTGAAMTPTHTRRKGKLYRYYISTDVLKNGANDCPVQRIPAGEIEEAVLDQIRTMLQSPEIIVATWRTARQTIPKLTEGQVRAALHSFDELWAELFPAEQARIVQLLVQRVDIAMTGAAITLRTDGLSSLIGQMRAGRDQKRAV